MNNTEGGGGLLPHFENRAADYYAFDWVGPQTWAQHLHYQLEMVYVEKGMLDVTIDFQTWHLRAGDLAIIFPYCVHGYHIDPDCAPDNHVLGIMALPPMAGEFEERLPVQLPQSPVLTGDQLNEEIIQAWYRLFIEREHYRPMIAKFYLQLLLALLWPLMEVSSASKQQRDDTAHRAIRYVVEHYRQPLQAKEVARELEISPSHLARIFSTRLHMGFNEYVNRLRVQAAQDLLQSTSRPVTEIMLDTGFESQSTFNRAFREIYGVSPRVYRQQLEASKP